jgi:methylated-DNA-protein-cysteine methyltransferase related protein
VPYDPARHGPHRVVGPGFHDRVHALVRAVPPGSVVTYGDLAAALGSRNVARQVGFAMAALPAGSDVPWWRVVAAGGRLATASAGTQREQARRLAREGVAVANGRVRAFAAHRAPFAG